MAIRSALATAATIAVVAGITAAVLGGLGAGSGGGSKVASVPSASIASDIGGNVQRPLHQLTICVDVVGLDASVRELAKAKVGEALPGVERHQYWVPSGLGQNLPLVDT